MEYFKFVSDRGTIEFCITSPYVLTSHENLNGAETQKQENKYIGIDGAEYTDILYEPDDMIIKGFIKAGSKRELPYYRAYLFKMLNGKDSGKLYYRVGNKAYFTEVLTLRPQIGEAVQNILNFTIHFKKIAPLWKEEQLRKYDVYMLTKNLKTEFTFPLVFSNHASRCNVLNGGDVDTDCIIKLNGIKKSEESTENEITVINYTTGEKMILSYLLTENEEIEIDTNRYTVTSSVNGNIMNAIKADSSFFKLAVGINDIEIINSDTENEIYASIEFYNVVLGV